MRCQMLPTAPGLRHPLPEDMIVHAATPFRRRRPRGPAQLWDIRSTCFATRASEPDCTEPRSPLAWRHSFFPHTTRAHAASPRASTERPSIVYHDRRSRSAAKPQRRTASTGARRTPRRDGWAGEDEAVSHACLLRRPTLLSHAAADAGAAPCTKAREKGRRVLDHYVDRIPSRKIWNKANSCT
jgi:hypothetical protein